MKKLWDYGNRKKTADPLIWKFLAANDAALDNIFLPYDIDGTMAHAKVLVKMNILSDKEFRQIKRVLEVLKVKATKGEVLVRAEDEDCHTVIESYLTKTLGPAGKKIQTGRSRNDQALTMIRLYMRDKIIEISDKVAKLKVVLSGIAKKYEKAVMPGYSHSQKAMPMTLGLYFRSFDDSLSDDIKLLKSVGKILNQSPLGSAAGFGLPIKWPKEIAAKELNFASVQDNPIYCQASRGKFERMFIFALEMIAQTLGRLSSDMVLFTMQEFRFFSLPDEFTTGSSFMPHKKNYDIFELARAARANIASAGVESGLYGFNLVSGYHRDLQRTKEPLVKAVNEITLLLDILIIALKELKVNEDKLKESISAEMNSTAQTLKMALNGTPFRDAYQTVKERLYGNL
jgi:argininosuccinate lyase